MTFAEYHGKAFCAFTSICNEDAAWLPTYLAEAERLGMPFVMHFDRCDKQWKDFARARTGLMVGETWNDRGGVFSEKDKQGAFDEVVRLDYRWAMAWDVDEAFEIAAPEKLVAIADSPYDQLVIPWVNLWGDEKHVRVDGPFAEGRRVKFYRVDRGLSWVFDHAVTNGPRPRHGREPFTGHADLVCLYRGMMTRDLREQKKERWDRTYGHHLRGDPNSYGFWDYALDEEKYPPVVRELTQEGDPV